MGKIYTNDGDESLTGFLGKGRVLKSHQKIKAIGSIDEANSAIGMARSFSKDSKLCSVLYQIQQHLQSVMADVSREDNDSFILKFYDPIFFNWLEQQIQEYEDKGITTNKFVIPGDTVPQAFLDFARTSVRKAERELVGLSVVENRDISEILKYLNRLSSLLFILELHSPPAE